jgi:hypothetical protein
MSQKLTIFRGDTPSATINLYTLDPVSGLSVVYSIPTGATITVQFPGDVSTVTLSTAVIGEVTILNALQGQISFLMSAVKSALLKLGDNQTLDVVVSALDGTITTAERAKVIKILDRANP